MRVLIVETNLDLAQIWARHLRRLGALVQCAHSQDQASEHLQDQQFDVVVLSVDLDEGSSFAIADIVSYRSPDTRIIAVSRSTFFADGSIFNLMPNTAAFVPSEMAPADLVAIVEHHATSH